MDHSEIPSDSDEGLPVGEASNVCGDLAPNDPRHLIAQLEKTLKSLAAKHRANTREIEALETSSESSLGTTHSETLRSLAPEDQDNLREIEALDTSSESSAGTLHSETFHPLSLVGSNQSLAEAAARLSAEIFKQEYIETDTAPFVPSERYKHLVQLLAEGVMQIMCLTCERRQDQLPTPLLRCARDKDSNPFRSDFSGLNLDVASQLIISQYVPSISLS